MRSGIQSASCKTMSTQTDPRQKVYEILHSFSTAMLVTSGLDGRPESRPMQMAKVEHGGDIWFLTGRSGHVVEQIEKDSVVLLIFQNEHSAYLSLSGRAQIEPDKAHLQELWKEPYKVWFSGGVEDPEIAVFSVEPLNAEYWDSRGLNRLEYMFEAAKAYVTGQRPDVSDVEQHAKTRL
jgi:general stress protein 26